MDGVSNNFALTPFYYLPQEVTLQIIEKLRTLELILLSGTCKRFYNLGEHGWKWLCKQDFRWLCSPSMEISSYPGISWRGLYKALAQDTQNIFCNSIEGDYEPYSSEIFVHPETGQVIALFFTLRPVPHYTLHVLSPTIDLSGYNEESG